MIDSNITINNIIINNRVVFQPMEGCDGDRMGGLTDLTIRRYMRFAEGGAGIIWFEAIAVTEEGKANPRQLMITPDNITQYKELIRNIKDRSQTIFGYEPIIIAQLTHGGRQSDHDGIPQPIVAYRSDYLEQGKENRVYTIADDEYCSLIPQMFAKSARLALDAGFDGIDVKCCHGYLLSEFLSAYDRPGIYGGEFNNRVKLLMDCVDAVRCVADGTAIITSRLNASDCYTYPNGYGVSANNEIDLTECKQIISLLRSKGVELVNISLGNPYLIPHINRPYIKAPESVLTGINRIHNIMLELTDCGMYTVMSGLTGNGINAISRAEELLSRGICDMVGFGRMTFAYPKFYVDYLTNGVLDSNKVCLLCGKCSELMRFGEVSGCPIRDKDIYLKLYRQHTK